MQIARQHELKSTGRRTHPPTVFYHPCNLFEDMAKYDFYQNDKCTVWHRTYFTIEAASEQEAYAMATTLIRDNELWNEDIIQVQGSEFILDTLEAVRLAENGYEPTSEIYASNDRLIADDVRGGAWDE